MPRRPGKKQKGKPAARSRPRWRKWFAIILLVGVLLPILQVIYVRFFDPPFTPLMAIRRIEGQFSREYSGQIKYQWIDLEKVPKYFLQCVWVTEDVRFFEHAGIDWKEIEAARVRAERTGGQIRGASTITMQCARSLFLWQGRSYIRKGLETYYTLLMEWLLSKRRILELYVNVIEMGDGVYGIQAASKYHYGRDAGRLSKSQCAMLAVMLPAPRKWNPNEPSRRLRSRYRRALRDPWKSRFPEDFR
jgi:monofunctional biosynthetic peptidoglycan transglycosylase